MWFLLCILLLVWYSRFHEGFYCPHTQSAIQAKQDLDNTKQAYQAAIKFGEALTASAGNKANEILAWNSELTQSLDIANENLAISYETKQNIESEYQTVHQQLNTCQAMNQLKLNAINIFS